MASNYAESWKNVYKQYAGDINFVAGDFDTLKTAIRQYMKDYDADYRILDESILTTGIGVAFAKNDTRGLSEQLSRVFEEMRACGTTRTIIGRYLSDPDKYLEVDCAAD